MQLNKVKLGNYIELYEERNYDNEYDEKSVRGIATSKKFIDTKANLDGVSLTSYKLVRPQMFAYVPDTSRRGDKISLAYNNSSETYLVSSISVIFKVREDKQDELLSDYLYIFFNRPEFDRYARFNSWGSAREPFNWEDMCDVEIELPDITVQQKYINIYMGLQKNIESYEGGKNDLKILCDAYIENLRRNMPCEEISAYIQEVNERNSDLEITNVKGVDSNSQFIPTKAKTEGLDFTKYKIVRRGQFAYNPSRINLGSIALSNEEDCIISPMYIVFEIIDTEKLLPEYLMMWLSRSEFYRSTLFFAIGSVRDTFDYNLMEEVKIPIPNIELQRKIVSIFNEYNNRNYIYDELKNIQKILCPILIKGSVEEAKKCEVASVG